MFAPPGLELLHLTVTLASRARWSQGYLTSRLDRRQGAGSTAGRRKVHKVHQNNSRTWFDTAACANALNLRAYRERRKAARFSDLSERDPG
jgi:hypothetical protein